MRAPAHHSPVPIRCADGKYNTQIMSATFISPEQYLALERESEIRHEYYNGQMTAMSSGNCEHSLIGGNVLGELWLGLRGRKCEVHGCNLRIKVSATGLYTYPDPSVVCGEPKLEDQHRDTLLNPVIIAEVLSPKTEAYDRGAKFANYRRIESLKEYVLIAQDRVRVERFVRQGEKWLLTEFTRLEDSLRLESIDCAVSLGSIYERISFELPTNETDDSERNAL